MRRTFVTVLSFVGILISFAAVSAKPVSEEVPFPNGFRDWFLVNSMIVTKDSPISDQIGGIHHIYVNATGLPTLKKGGPFPYPDGTVFADDVHEFSVRDGSYVEGNKKAVPVMVRTRRSTRRPADGDSKCGPGATPRNRSFPTPPMPSRLASSATRRKKARTTRFQPTFPEKSA
jgi:hypothetical protein